MEILYNEYNFAAAFAVASVLALMALVTLAAKSMLGRRKAGGGATGFWLRAPGFSAEAALGLEPDETDARSQSRKLEGADA